MPSQTWSKKSVGFPNTGKGKGGRGDGPGAKAGEEPQPHRKAVKLNIREIVDKDTGKRPTAKNLIRDLENNVRKVLEAKRNEFDKTHFLWKKRTGELEAVKLELRDLRKDGEALGLEDYPDEKERLQPIKSISTRPVFSKHTRLSKMVDELDERKMEIDKVTVTGQIYDHMRQRLMAERVEEKKRNGDLRYALKEAQLRNSELKRREITSAETLGNAKAKLERLKKDVAHDIGLWQHEIKDRESWAKQKDQFDSFLQKQLKKQREIELEAKGDMGDVQEKALKVKTAASVFANRHMSRKLSITVEAATIEEKRFEDAFRRIGLKVDEVAAPDVIRMCISQDETRRELLRKRAEAEEKVETLKKQVSDAQGKLQHTMFDKARTTNRVLAEREKRLSEIEKKLEAERSEYQFMQSTVQPVRIGLQHLAAKILDREVDLLDVSEIEWVLEQIHHKLTQIMEETRQVAAADPTVPTLRPALVPTAAPGDRATLTSSGPLSMEGEAADTPAWLMSPYNVRVKPKAKADDDDDDDGRTDRNRSRKGRDRSRPVSADHHESSALGGSGDEGDDTVLNRDQVKGMSRSFVSVELRKLRKPRKKASHDGSRLLAPPSRGRARG